MEIIQIASDKKGEIWFFDKHEKKLVKMDIGIMAQYSRYFIPHSE